MNAKEKKASREVCVGRRALLEPLSPIMRVAWVCTFSELCSSTLSAGKCECTHQVGEMKVSRPSLSIQPTAQSTRAATLRTNTTPLVKLGAACCAPVHQLFFPFVHWLQFHPAPNI